MARPFGARARSEPSDGAGEAFVRRARELADAPALPELPELEALVDATLSVLDAESAALRPKDSSGRPGGLLVLPAQPVVLVPDLHARPFLLADVFGWRPPIAGPASDRPAGGRRSLASLLASGSASLVCLGDLFHSEAGGARDRWMRAYNEYASGWETHAAMDEEMALALTAARIVFEAKLAFPESFHYLKGNHDNIADEEGRGDHSFYKFAAEGEMVASWFFAAYSESLLERYREVELDLPILALGPRFVASHAEPAFALTKTDIVEYRSRPEVVEALIWTPNDGAEEGSVTLSMDALLGPERALGALWFAGHRPVIGRRYALRAGGRFVQFHDPGARRVACLEPDRDPDPDRDILDID
jgi:hypothetical protein